MAATKALLRGAPSGELNAKSITGNTALHLAAIYGHAAVCEALLARPDLDRNATNGNGYTALAFAVRDGRHAVAALLRA